MKGARKPMVPAERSPLLGVADEALARRLTLEIERTSRIARVVSTATVQELRYLAARVAPDVILFDCDLLEGAPLDEFFRHLTVTAPVILLAPTERQPEIARLVAGGDVEFVPRTGDFVPLAAAFIERRLRWAAMSDSVLGPPWVELPTDIGAVFRHEINNPLTGILGNAELLLAHRERLTAVDTQRLQTVVDLAVRLRETIRRLSNAWDTQRRNSLKSA